MKPQHLIVYDNGAGRWGPMTDLRPVFDLRTGAMTSLQGIECVVGLKACALLVPAGLKDLTLAGHPGTVVNDGPKCLSGPCLVVDGRWLGLRACEQVRNLEPGACVVQEDGQIVAAMITPEQFAAMAAASTPALPEGLKQVEVANGALINRPWDILAGLAETLAFDLEAIDLPVSTGDASRPVVGKHAFKVAADAKINPFVVINTEAGIVAIDSGATIGSFTTLAGPLYIGKNSTIAPHAQIRPNSVIGDTCTVGGEVSHSIIDSNTNKAHSGYLGNSLVGQWANLGADTKVSNLKNTYGSVRVQLDSLTMPEDTGQIKQGPIIGDFVRTAIGSRLLTGSCISTCAMVAISAMAPKYVEPFAFLTDDGPDRFHIDRLLVSLDRALSRRGHKISPAMAARLRSMALPA